MSLLIFENYLKLVDQVLGAESRSLTDAEVVDLENILVSHGVVLLYARMEQCFQSAIESKCGRCLDLEVRAFALSVKNEKTGKVLLDSIKGTFKRFGIDHKVNLTPQLEGLNVVESWDSIVNVRQRVAHHGERAALTLSDLRTYYNDIRKVLGCICIGLALEQGDIAQICKLIDVSKLNWTTAPAVEL